MCKSYHCLWFVQNYPRKSGTCELSIKPSEIDFATYKKNQFFPKSKTEKRYENHLP